MANNAGKAQARNETVSTRVSESEKRDLEMLALAGNTSVSELLRPRVEELVQKAAVLREKLQSVA